MNSVKKECEKNIITSLNNNVFSGAAVAFSQLGREGNFKRILTYGGKSCKSGEKCEVNKETLFDLASLTKPLVTVLCTLHLIEDGIIDWQEKIDSLLCQKVEQGKEEITLFHLLSHCSGLPAHKPYYKECENKDDSAARETIIKKIVAEPLVYIPGQSTVYSDLGFILLGHIIEKKRGARLDDIWEKNIARPFRLQNKLLFLKNDKLGPKRRVATPYNSCVTKSGFGVVNDDNCRVMGGVAGHAGLFGTLEGVLTSCENILKQYKKIIPCKPYSNKVLKKALKKMSRSSWTCGFDTPSLHNSLSGDYFSQKTVGHLGYTGTSFWIDLEKNAIVVVLTSRTHLKKGKEEINKFRRTIHNTIMRDLSSY